jgi:hypothetical protein
MESRTFLRACSLLAGLLVATGRPIALGAQPPGAGTDTVGKNGQQVNPPGGVASQLKQQIQPHPRTAPGSSTLPSGAQPNSHVTGIAPSTPGTVVAPGPLTINGNTPPAPSTVVAPGPLTINGNAPSTSGTGASSINSVTGLTSVPQGATTTTDTGRKKPKR